MPENAYAVATAGGRPGLPDDQGKVMWGTTAQRPVATAAHLGWDYFDTTTSILFRCLFTTTFAWTQIGSATYRNLFDHFADGASSSTDGVGEDDLYTDTLEAGLLATNGDKVLAQYAMTIVGSATATRRVRSYFGGTLILDSGTLTFASGGAEEIWVSIIRETSSVVRVSAELVPSGITLQPIVTYTRITGLTLTNTQIIKVTGSAGGAGAAAADIVAKLGFGEWRKAV